MDCNKVPSDQLQRERGGGKDGSFYLLGATVARLVLGCLTGLVLGKVVGTSIARGTEAEVVSAAADAGRVARGVGGHGGAAAGAEAAGAQALAAGGALLLVVLGRVATEGSVARTGRRVGSADLTATIAEGLDLLKTLLGGDTLATLVVGLEQAPLLLTVLLLLLSLGGVCSVVADGRSHAAELASGVTTSSLISSSGRTTRRSGRGWAVTRSVGSARRAELCASRKASTTVHTEGHCLKLFL